jgi:hypothetical protein
MKRLFTFLIVSVLLISSHFALAAKQTDDKQILSSAVFTIKESGENLNIEKFKTNNNIGISISSKSGESLLEMKELGVEEKLFTVGEKPTSLIVKDVTGDGVPEVITAAYYGPASALYVFKFDKAKRKFLPMKFIDSKDASMHRDFMVSDMPQDNGQDMTIMANNNLRALGKIYPAKAGQKATPGLYFFVHKKGAFKLQKTEKIN